MAYLEIASGEQRGKTVRLLQAEVIIGRNADTHLCLPDTNVSRQHAAIRPKDNYYVIVDLGSANGTVVNKRTLHRFVPQPLYEGDEIQIGNTTMHFKAEGQDPLGAKKKAAAGTVTVGSIPKMAVRGGLSMILTSETRIPSVNATMDASLSSLAVRDEEKSSPQGLLDALRRLQAMVKVSQDLGTLTKPEALLAKVMDSIFDMFPNADRAFIMLRDAASRELVPAMGRNRDTESPTREFPISRTIISTVVEKKQSILSSDAQKDGRFASRHSIVDLSIRSLMCAPFICQGELLGIISVDTMSSKHVFSADDLAMLTSIAGQAAIAIKNAELYTAVEKETQVRTQLSRYLSPDVVEGVIDGTIPLKLGGERKRGTVLFCDIVGFTAMAESLSALEVVELLNRYFRITTGIITKHQGTLHKFGGDMIMAFWNVLFADENAEANAVRASIEMQAAVWKFGCECAAAQQPPIFIGIGCNTGEFAGGNIGGEDRMEYTIIGDNVNLAQRIESLASRWQVFAAQQTFGPASADCIAVKMPPAVVKGKTLPIQVYSIRGIRIDTGDLLLTIPVILRREPSDAGVGGLLTGFRGEAGELLVCVPSDARFTAGDRIVCDLDCPELAAPAGLRVTVKGREGQDADSPHNAILVLCDGEGEEVMAFLKPGVVVQSTKTWADMTRH
jgi:adenylate cyclase